ncbi:murein DD-endopeptidase MepM/ murein hydrolase activator NlpD [Streptacidiphilus sp. MAP12-16]|uniref:SMODS domain-containing nucleotidyltransferase n=1 Tax=Streptacidiphilus sp. MAP12-16 TaxID=3156300 RepID=UPI003518FDFD
MKLNGHFTTLLKGTVNLNQTRLDQLDGRVTAIMNFLNSDSILGPLILGTTRQGSWAHRTIIKPVAGKKDEFDADFLLNLTIVEAWTPTPSEYLNALYAALKRSSTYKSMVVKKNRCVRINYTGDCHVDIVPHLVQPGGLQVIVNSEEEKFEETDPEGYTEWMKEKDSLTGGNLRKVIRLVKYLRDSKDTFSIPSVILTALLGERVQVYDTDNRYSGVATTLVHLIEDLATWLALNPQMPIIADPSCPQTSFNHRWDQDRYTNFAKHIQSYATRMRTALDEQDKDKSIKLWQDLFGDGFRAPATTTEASLAKAEQPALREAATRAPSEKFIEEMGLRLAGGRRARIEARVANPIGTGSADLRRTGFAPVGRDIYFTVTTDAPQPYEIWWKIRNHGPDAENAQGLRGEIKPGRGTRIHERTKYRGRHYVEVWIVKDGKIVASDHHDVVIR